MGLLIRWARGRAEGRGAGCCLVHVSRGTFTFMAMRAGLAEARKSCRLLRRRRGRSRSGWVTCRGPGKGRV